MKLYVNNLLDEQPLSLAIMRLLRLATREVACYEQLASRVEVTITLADDHAIHQLNRQYRQIDRPTDVLSFALTEGEEFPLPSLAPQLLGDIIISLETAKRQATEYQHSCQRELAFLVVHGMLHLLGYDHQSEPDRRLMRAHEDAIMRRVGLNRHAG